MEPFRTLTGIAAPLLLDDVNTDQIIPSAWLRDPHADLAAGFFGHMRRRPDGSRDLDFALEKPQFRTASILLVGDNFGCGSSREHAVWAMLAFGIRCVIGRSIADFFRENCLKNGVLPITLAAAEMDQLAARAVATDGTALLTVDLEARRITVPDGPTLAFALPEPDRAALLDGTDDIALTLRQAAEIEAWEAATRAARPFLQQLTLPS
jgi:3-isopropylmalate dehydratase small subunit